MKVWGQAEDEWELESIEQIKGIKKIATPLVRTRRFQIPFQCRFCSQDVSKMNNKLR